MATRRAQRLGQRRAVCEAVPVGWLGDACAGQVALGDNVDSAFRPRRRLADRLALLDRGRRELDDLRRLQVEPTVQGVVHNAALLVLGELGDVSVGFVVDEQRLGRSLRLGRASTCRIVIGFEYIRSKISFKYNTKK